MIREFVFHIGSTEEPLMALGDAVDEMLSQCGGYPVSASIVPVRDAEARKRHIVALFSGLAEQDQTEIALWMLDMLSDDQLDNLSGIK